MPRRLNSAVFRYSRRWAHNKGTPSVHLLFCLPLQPILMRCSSPVTLGYLDDLTLGGEESIVTADVELIERESGSLGLHLNHSKCEVISRGDTSTKFYNLKNCKPVNPKAASLLGSPLSDSEALEQTLESHCKSLSLAITRLGGIGRHDALILLRNSLNHPKLLYTLRCCPCVDHPLLKAFDNLLRTGLETVLNLSLDDSHWAQASLPVKAGGLGIRRVTLLALPSFLASAAGTRCLQSAMLGGLQIPDDEPYATLRDCWCTDYSSPCPDDISAHKQSVWDKPVIHRETSSLIDSFSEDYDKARFRAVAARHSSDWLLALPITTCGLRLDDEAVREAVGLRLGVNICEPHECRCGTMVKANGSHGLSCSLGPGRTARHANLNELICRGLVRAGIPGTKEPTGLSRTDGKRQDGLTLIPWRIHMGYHSDGYPGRLLPSIHVGYCRCRSRTGSTQEMRQIRCSF